MSLKTWSTYLRRRLIVGATSAGLGIEGARICTEGQREAAMRFSL
jgi:hypothetical protein